MQAVCQQMITGPMPVGIVLASFSAAKQHEILHFVGRTKEPQTGGLMIGTQVERALHAVPSSAAEVEQAIKRIPGLEQAGAQLGGSIHNAVLAGGGLTR